MKVIGIKVTSDVSKKLDLNKTVFDIMQEYPEFVHILAGLGFTGNMEKTMLHSVGKMITIPKGTKNEEGVASNKTEEINVINKKIGDKQKNYSSVTDKVDKSNEEKQKLLVIEASKEDTKRRVEKIKKFIVEQETSDIQVRN